MSNYQIPPIELISGSHAVAIVECPDCIACNPCSTVCKFGAITVESVEDIPILDFSKCKGCGMCKRNCPVGAISGEIKQPHVIDKEKCIKCGTCISVCPFHAIS